MGDDETEGDETNGQKRPRGTVNDPEEAGQRARIRAIQKALQEAISRRTEAEDSVLSGGAAEQDRLHYYRTGVEQFLLQIVSLVERTEADHYWEEAEIGTVHVPVPENIEEAMRDSQTRVPWGEELPEPNTIEIEGLAGFLERSWPHTERFELSTGRTDRIAGESTVEPPKEVIDNVLITALKFLGDTGLDIELDLSKPTIRDFDASEPSEQIDYEEVQGTPDL